MYTQFILILTQAYPMKIAQIYLRVSTIEQSNQRQEKIIDEATKNGYYIAKVYREKASGAIKDRPKLRELISDLQPGEIIVAENIDRISRLPLQDAMDLVNEIREKGAFLSIPNIVDLGELMTENQTELSKIIMLSVQEMLLKMALQIARDDYELRRERQLAGIALAKKNKKYKGRKPDLNKHQLILDLWATGNYTEAEIAKRVDCSLPQVKRVKQIYKTKSIQLTTN